MKDILDKLIESINNGNIIVALVIIIVALIFNCRKIIEFIDDRKKTRINILQEALECEHIDGITRDYLESQLVTEHFNITNHMNVEKEFREAILNAHKSTSGEIRFIHFRRALQHIKYKKSQLSIQVSLFERISFWLNLIFGIILILLGLILMILSGSIPDISLIQIIYNISLGLFFIAFGILMLKATLPVISAKQIEPYINMTHKPLSQKDS